MPWAWADAPLAVLYECFRDGRRLVHGEPQHDGARPEPDLRPAAVVAPERAAPAPGGGEAAALTKLQALTAAFETVGDAVR